MDSGPARRRLFLPAGYGERDLDLAEKIILHLDLKTLWVSWLVGKGPAQTPTLRGE
jgi:hypothetical protein